MTFAIPEGLAPEAYPLAWLVGTWRGEGVLAYPGIEESPFTAEVEVESDGGPYLSWSSRWWLLRAPDDVAPLDVAARPDPVWATEIGWWRLPPQDPSAAANAARPVELLIADPSGHVAVYVGEVRGARIDLASDVIARTETGAEVTAGRRLLGLVEGDLMWAFDLAAFGHPVRPYASARMRRVS